MCRKIEKVKKKTKVVKPNKGKKMPSSKCAVHGSKKNKIYERARS